MRIMSERDIKQIILNSNIQRMSIDEVNSSIRRGQQQLSSTQKKEILWNIIEPGDPYDIKKSMIAKLPGDRQNFMGDHIELVCLMQAAEIQRLCEYLEQYKLRYREIQRRELDRHSYEVQIKELTQQLTDQGYHKTENLKLRDFLKKQTAELEQLRKKSSTDDGIGKKYEGALKQIQILIQQNSSLKAEKNGLTLELQQLFARFTALESSKQREFDELRSTLTTQTNVTFERQKQQLAFKFQTEINRLEFEVKRLKDINDTKNREIEELQMRFRRVEAQLNEQINKQSRYLGLENTIREYESKFGVLSKQIQRLNYVLRNKANECEELTGKLRQLEDQLVRRNHEVDEYNQRARRYELRINEMNTVINELNVKVRQLGETEIASRKYQQKIEQLSLEIERLNNVLKKKLTEITDYQAKLNDLEYELKKVELVKKQNQELRRFVNENSELRRKLAEFQNKMPLLSNEIDRLNNMLRNKNDEVVNWQQRFKTQGREVDELRIRIDGYEREISSNWKSRISMMEQQNSNYQRENDELKRRLQDLGELNRRLTQYENRIALMSQEIERLNEVIKGLRGENDEYRRRMIESGDLSRKNNEYEARITALLADIQQINQSSKIKLTEYENRIREIGFELEKANGKLKSKLDEQPLIENRIRSLEQENDSLKKYHSEIEFKFNQQIQSKLAIYESRIRQYSSENEETSRKISQYQSKIALLSQELERLNALLRTKSDDCINLQSKYRLVQQELETSRRQISQDFQTQLNNYELKLKQAAQENEEFRRRLQELGDVNRKLSDYENRIALLSQELERLNLVLKMKMQQNGVLQSRNRNLQQELDSQRKGTIEYESRFTQVTQELQTRVTTSQNKLKQSSLENQELRRRLQQLAEGNRKLSEYENRIMLLGQELERLNGNLRNKVEEYNALDAKFRGLQAQYDNSRRGVTEYEYKFSQISQEYQSKVSSYESVLKQASQENDELRRRLQELGDLNRKASDYETKIAMLSQELQRLNGLMRTKQEENFGLETRLRSSINEIENLKRVQSQLQARYSQQIQSKITIYETKIKRSEQESQQLIKKIRELSESSRKIPEYQSRILILSQELEKANNGFRTKFDEFTTLESRLRASQQENENLKRSQGELQLRFNQEFKSKISTYQSRIKQTDGEVDELRRRLQEAITINREYEDRLALLSQQIDRLNGNLRIKVEENSGIENKLRSALQQLDGYKRGTGEIQYKVRQYADANQQLKRKIIELAELNKNLPEYQNRIMLLSQELQKLTNTLRIKGEEIRSLQQENDKLKRSHADIDYEYNAKFQGQIQANETRIRRVEAENDDLKRRLQESELDNSRKLSEYSNRATVMSQELQRLNLVLQAKVDENLNLENKLRYAQQEADSLRRGGSETEYKIVQITQEYQTKISTYQTKLKVSVQQNEELRRRLQELGDVNRKIAQYENRIILLSQQLERLNGNLRAKMEENANLESRLRTVQQDSDGLRRGATEFEYKLTQVTQEYQLKISSFESRQKQLGQQNEELRRNLQELSNVSRKISQYENKIVILSQQLERVNSNLRNKVDDNNNLETALRNLQQENERLKKSQADYEFRFSQEYQTQISNFDGKLKQAQQENQELRRKLQQFSEINRKLADYEAKIVSLSQEIQRLNGILRVKLEENTSLDGRVRQTGQELENLRRQYEFKITQITQEYQLKIRTSESSFKTMTQDNQQLRLKLREVAVANAKISEYESRITMMAQQIQRLNSLLKAKVEENSNYENRFRAYQQQIEGLKRAATELEFKLREEHQLNQDLKLRLQGVGDINRKISQYETKIALLSQEIERLNSAIRLKVEENGSYETKVRSIQQELNLARRTVSEFEFKFTQASQQYQLKISNYETRIKQQNAQIEDLKRKMQGQTDSILAQYENKMALLSQEIERLNYILKKTNDELEQHRQNDFKYLSEIQRLNNTLRLKVEESSRYESAQADLINRIKILEERNNQIVTESNGLKNTNAMLSSQYENSKKHLLEYQQSIKKLYAEFERLQTIMQQLKRENYNLKVELRESEGLIEKNRVLSAEIDRLVQIIEVHKSEISELRIRFADEAALHKRINEHMALMVVLFAEIESLRQRVKDKEKEVEDVRRSSLAPFKV